MCRKLSNEHIKHLLYPFSQTELHKVIFQMHPDKVLGPDGFSVRFFPHFWPTVGNLVIEMLLSFMNKGHLLRVLNQSLICPIPKGKSQQISVTLGLQVYAMLLIGLPVWL